MYWYVWHIFQCIHMYLYVFACIMYGYVLHCICVYACIGMYCMYIFVFGLVCIDVYAYVL